MKIAVLNYSGNVGKTTVAKHLLVPRIPNCEWIPIESINSGGDEKLNFRGKNFGEVLSELMISDDVVVDIGSSNIEQVFEQMRKIAGSQNEFDYFVIPTVPSEKQQQDTRKVVADLIELDVDPKKIKIIFNQVPHEKQVEKIFGELIELLKVVEVNVSPKAVIHENEVFALLAKNQTLKEAVGKGRDYKAEISAAKDREAKKAIAQESVASRMAIGVDQELDAAFQALFEGS